MLADGVATYHSQRSILKVSNTLNNKYDTETFFGFSYLPLGFLNCQHTIIVKLKIDIQGVLQVCEFRICEFYLYDISKDSPKILFMQFSM